MVDIFAEYLVGLASNLVPGEFNVFRLCHTTAYHKPDYVILLKRSRYDIDLMTCH